VGQYVPNFHAEGTSPPIIFARIVRPMNALQDCTDSFHTKKLCSRLSSSEMRFYTESGRYAFLSPPKGLRSKVQWSSYS